MVILNNARISSCRWWIRLSIVQQKNIYLKSNCVNRLAIAMATADVFVLVVCYIQYIYCIGINLSH